MSMRLEMLQVARLAPKLLGESTELVSRFIRAQQNANGGFKDRSGNSDLYYTVFGLDALIALQQPLKAERVTAFLESFGAGVDLDFVHLCALARCRAAVATQGGGPATARSITAAMGARLATYRAANGGFNPVSNNEHGTAYGAFLALGAYQDCGLPIPEPSKLAQSLTSLETADGAWTNEVIRGATGRSAHSTGSTNATAACITVLRNLGEPIPRSAGGWLLARAHPQGGFLAMPNAPMPDLLSTATALHALAGLGVPFGQLRESCLDFVDSLWTNDGSFHGNWADDHLDCEYTFYGLLALGHLAV